MEISLINSSCRNPTLFSSQFHRFDGNSNSPISVSFTNLNKFRSTTSISGKIIPMFPTSTTRVCSLGEEDNGAQGVAANVIGLDTSHQMKKKAMEIQSELKGTSMFLIGMSSTIKTNVARLLADTLGYYYFDSDDLVEQAAGGKDAAKKFRDTDETGYRESETEVLKQLSSMGRLVVCAGNGAVQSSINLSFLRYGISIWIDVPLDTLAAEVVGNGDQIPVTSDPSSEETAKLLKVYKEMRDGYATADATISVQKIAGQLGYEEMSAVTTEELVLETLKEIEKLTRVKKMMEAAATPF